jgi:pilus assembly protein FimV
MTGNSLKWTLAALIVGSPAAMALGLGDIHLHSSLNAPLDADIDLVGATPDDLTSLKAQVASRDVFQQNGLDWPAFLSTVTLQPTRTSDGREIIKVHSGVAITEPFVTLLVEINWARGHVTHEYTVLLDPPVYTPDQSQAAVAAPAVGAGTRGGTIEREPAAAPPPPAPAAPPPAAPTPSSAAPATSGQTYRVQRGDSLSRIAAHESSATSPPEVRRWMVATYEGNPGAFDRNMNLLRAGAVLRMPDAAALGAVSTGDALAEVRRQYAAWHAGAPATTPATPSAPSSSATSESGRLRLVTPGTAAGAGSAASAASASQALALQSKVQQLQSQLDESQRLLALRNADLAKLQAQLAAAQSAKSAAAPAPAAPSEAPAPTPAPAAAPETAAAPAAEQNSAPTEAQAPAPATAENAAAASAPPVKHTPQITSVPVGQGSSSVMGLLRQYWWALAALIAVIAAYFGLRAWRERRQSSFDDSLGHLGSRADADTGEHETSFDTQPLVPLRAESILVEESGSHAKPRFDGTASNRAPHIAADQTISAETAVNLDQGDPLAEADFHMAYGLYDQAADLVRIAIARDPKRRDLKLKLLEVFFVWGNKDQFLNSARELAASRAEAAPGEWEKILIMGKQLAPEDPLFSTGSAVSGAAAAGVDLDLEGGQSSDIDFDLIGSPSSVQRAADDIDLDIGTAIGERDATAEMAAANATDKNLALTAETTAIGDTGTGSTQEMTQGRMAAARFGGLNDGITQESPTIEQPLGGANGAATVRQKVEKVLQKSAGVEQTAELAIDDLGLDLNSLDTVDQPALGAGADAPTMVAGLDEHSRRLLETAEHRGPEFSMDPAETPTGSWQFDGTATDAPLSVEGAEHDLGATASLKALTSDLDFNIGMPEHTEPPPAANGQHGLDLDVGTATIPDAAFAQTQRLGTEDLALPDLEPVTMSEVGTKLDLARAYMDMGDPEGARNILEEVVTEGSVAQKQEAQRLIESLPG